MRLWLLSITVFLFELNSKVCLSGVDGSCGGGGFAVLIFGAEEVGWGGLAFVVKAPFIMMLVLPLLPLSMVNLGMLLIYLSFFKRRFFCTTKICLDFDDLVVFREERDRDFDDAFFLAFDSLRWRRLLERDDLFVQELLCDLPESLTWVTRYCCTNFLSSSRWSSEFVLWDKSWFGLSLRSLDLFCIEDFL